MARDETRPGPADTIPGAWHATGRTRIRAGWFGILIVEMEETSIRLAAAPGPGLAIGVAGKVMRWRRAPRGYVVTFGVGAVFRSPGQASP